MPYNTQTVDNREFLTNDIAPLTSDTAVIFSHGYRGNAESAKQKLGNPEPNNYHMVFTQGRIINPVEPTQREFYTENDEKNVEDYGYFASIINFLKTEKGVTKIIKAGHSQGARAAYAFNALFPQLLSGLVTVSGFLDNKHDVIRIGNIPMVHIHGVSDNIAPVFGANYNIRDNMTKFIAAGHTNFESILLNNGHTLDDMQDRVMLEINKMVDSLI